MDIGILAIIIPITAIVSGAIGWIFRQYQYRHEIRRQASHDAGNILKERKKILKEILSQTNDNNKRQSIAIKLDEVNAALLGLYTKMGQNILKEAGLPTEEILISDGKKPHPEQSNRLSQIIEELTSFPTPLSIESLRILAYAYYYTKRYHDAKPVYDKIIEINPYDHVAFRHRGATYIHMNKYKQAIIDFDNSLELKPDEPIALHDRGVALKKLGYFKDAINNYNRALKLKPDDPTILNNRGLAYTKLERYEEALADFNRSLELKPDDPDTLYNLACLFSLWGKTDKALTYLEKAIALDESFREQAKTDKNFDNIRDDPRFKKLLDPD